MLILYVIAVVTLKTSHLTEHFLNQEIADATISFIEAHLDSLAFQSSISSLHLLSALPVMAMTINVLLPA